VCSADDSANDIEMLRTHPTAVLAWHVDVELDTPRHLVQASLASSDSAAGVVEDIDRFFPRTVVPG